MSEDKSRLLRGRGLERLRADVRIAVAVAADPGAHGEKRRQPGRALEREAHAQGFFQVRVQARDPRNESEAEIGERIGDLVRHRELREAQHRRQPQPQHLRVQGALASGRVGQRDQARDLALALEDALALHLGGMRGQHRAHAGAREPLEQRRARRLRRALQRIREASRPPRRAALRVRAAPAAKNAMSNDAYPGTAFMGLDRRSRAAEIFPNRRFENHKPKGRPRARSAVGAV